MSSGGENKGKVAWDILKTIAVGGFLLSCLAMPNLGQVIKLFKSKNKKQEDKVKRSFRSLQDKGYVKVNNFNGRDFIKMTDKGKLYFSQLDLKKRKAGFVWDKLWRVVVFDIPENKKIARRALSRKLKQTGFYPMQKSVFVFPYNCKEEIDFIISYFSVEKYVNYFVARNMGSSEKAVRNFFGL